MAEDTKKAPLAYNLDLTVLFGFLVLILFLLIVTQFVLYQNGLAHNVVISSDMFASTVEIIVNCVTAFVVLLGGTNAGRAFLKIGYLPDTATDADCNCNSIPPWKTTQMLVFTILLMVLEVLTIVFQLVVGTDRVDFYIKNVTGALAAAILTYVAMRTTPKVAEGVYLAKPEEKKPKEAPK
jgi:hypothetical protein